VKASVVHTRRFAVLGAVLVALLVMAALPAVAAEGGGNLKCSELGLEELLLDDAPSYAGQIVSNSDVTVEITAVGEKLDGSGEIVKFMWTQLDGPTIEWVVVKGGPGNYKYPGSFTGYLWAPIKGEPGTGSSHHGISNVRWCYPAGARPSD
jgi:hypothetical protein